MCVIRSVLKYDLYTYSMKKKLELFSHEYKFKYQQKKISYNMPIFLRNQAVLQDLILLFTYTNCYMQLKILNKCSLLPYLNCVAEGM